MAISTCVGQFGGTITMNSSAAQYQKYSVESLKLGIRSDQFVLCNLVNVSSLQCAVGNQAKVIENLWYQNRHLISMVLQKLWRARDEKRLPRIRFVFDSPRFWLEVFFHINRNVNSTPLAFGLYGYDREEDCRIKDCRLSQFILRRIGETKGYGWESAERLATMERHLGCDNFDLVFETSICNVDNPGFFQRLVDFMKEERDTVEAEIDRLRTRLEIEQSNFAENTAEAKRLRRELRKKNSTTNSPQVA